MRRSLQPLPVAALLVSALLFGWSHHRPF